MVNDVTRTALRNPANWRLVSGIVLFVFVATHLLNHTLGLISIGAMNAGREVFLVLWRNLVGTGLLLGSMMAHTGLSLYALYRRRLLRDMRPGEIAQTILGLSVPPLLILHILGTRGANELFSLNDTYEWVLLNLWLWTPVYGVIQVVVLVAAWLHGCIGLHYWLRLKPWYRRYRGTLYTVALLLPAAALAGYTASGREVLLLSRDPAWMAAMFDAAGIADPGALGPAVDQIYTLREIALWLMLAILVAVLAARQGRLLRLRRRGLITISYPEDRRATVPPGVSVLEASRLFGIPHASVCGGRGRCSTCRVLVREGNGNLTPPEDNEIQVLRRVNAPEGVRLACQIRPAGDIAVIPLLPPTAQPADAFRGSHAQGGEREIAILFADLRAFTRLAENKLPYDVVFVLNEYFRAVGQAVEQAGGHIDKFIGDGVMALFGLDTGSDTGCRQALQAARGIAQAMEGLNRKLEGELTEPLRIGIGIHIGAVIVGEMGYGRTTSLTAIGDAVNTASRLESMTKEFGAQLVVSRRVARRAGIDLSRFPRHQIEVRGRRRPLSAFVVEHAMDLPTDDTAGPEAISKPENDLRADA